MSHEVLVISASVSIEDLGESSIVADSPGHSVLT